MPIYDFLFHNKILQNKRWEITREGDVTGHMITETQPIRETERVVSLRPTFQSRKSLLTGSELVQNQDAGRFTGVARGQRSVCPVWTAPGLEEMTLAQPTLTRPPGRLNGVLKRVTGDGLCVSSHCKQQQRDGDLWPLLTADGNRFICSDITC